MLKTLVGRKLVVLIAPAALPLASLSLAPLPLASQRIQRTSGSLRAERQLGSFPFWNLWRLASIFRQLSLLGG